MQTKTWGNYLAKRMTFPMDSRNLHYLFCPDDRGSGETTSRDNRKSVAALQRIDNNLRMSIRSITSGLEQALYDDGMDGSRRLGGISESGDTASHHADNDRASFYADPDDDIDAISRAFSVASMEDLDTEEYTADHTNAGGLPQNFLDDSENYDSQPISHDPQTYHSDQESQEHQSNYDDQEIHNYHSDAGSMPRSLYNDENEPRAQSFYEENCCEDTQDMKSLAQEYYDTDEAVPFISDANSIT